MRILFYGGCHASVIKNIFKAYSKEEIDADIITNYKLIESNTPFPWDRIKDYDMIIMNPILNKGSWNTSHIEDAARQTGTRIIKYPWLQWNGYWPGAEKDSFGPDKLWRMPALNPIARRHQSFSEFYESTFTENPFLDIVDANTEKTTKRLKNSEITGETDIKISDWILDNHQSKQLFLTPDHPSTVLYQKLIADLSDASGVSIDPEFFNTSIQLQEGIRLPIIPGIGRMMHLQFASIEWRHDEIFPGVHFSYDTYLRTYFSPELTSVCHATHRTALKMSDPNTNQVIRRPIRKGQKFLAQVINDDDDDGHHSLCMIYDAINPRENITASLYKTHWQITPIATPF